MGGVSTKMGRETTVEAKEKERPRNDDDEHGGAKICGFQTPFDWTTQRPPLRLEAHSMLARFVAATIGSDSS